MPEIRRHLPANACPAYGELKPLMRRAGLFACSEVGFNLALDPLTRMYTGMMSWLASGAPGLHHQATPPLLRSDWVAGEWHNPPSTTWCREEPGGHLLTPRPVMHLLNRQRWHPVVAGVWVLTGWCFRDEEPASTLPLLRQRAFIMTEHARIGTPQECTAWAASELMRWWDLGVRLDLPLSHHETDTARCDGRINLELPGTGPICLVHAELLPASVSSAYLEDGLACATVGLGLERWLLALAARHGVEPEFWPELPE